MIYQLNLIISMTEIISFAQIRISDDFFTSLRLGETPGELSLELSELPLILSVNR